MFTVNVRAPFFLMQDAAKLMIRKKIRGRDGQHPFDVLAWRAAVHHRVFGLEGRACHTDEESGLLTLAEQHPRERPEHRLDGYAGRAPDPELYHDAPSDWLAKAEAGTPFGRLLKPTEVARAVAYLASESSGMMTGSIIDFDQQLLGAAETAVWPSSALAI